DFESVNVLVEKTNEELSDQKFVECHKDTTVDSLLYADYRTKSSSNKKRERGKDKSEKVDGKRRYYGTS
ncbi:18149_t:CDS:1, partial [Acaulospora morrowiae]